VTTGPSHHNLFFYSLDDGFVERVAPFLAEGLREHEAVVGVVDPRKRALLTEALGELAPRIDWIDRDAYYTRPEDALAGYDAQVRRYLRNGAPRVRVFGELPICRSREESDTWILYEAILNPAFAEHPVTIVCGVDAREQNDEVLSGSLHTHPRAMNDRWTDIPYYHDPREVVRARTPAPADVNGLTRLRPDADARELRERLRAEMAEAGVADADAREMVVATGEVLANAHRYGGGVRALRAGPIGERFVCEVADHGPGLDDPLAGYLPPRPGSGAGLWVARQLTRRLEMISTGRGLTTRLWR
jgi:anti-sigma regulatory factor (Ser/Thr protein kinase)